MFNFVKRGACGGENAKISWTQVETGSSSHGNIQAILAGDRSLGEFYSIALTSNYQQAEIGTKMIHLVQILKAVLFQRYFCLKFNK